MAFGQLLSEAKSPLPSGKGAFCAQLYSSSGIEQNLGKDETICKKAEIHFAVIIPHIVLMFVLVGFLTIWKPLFAIFTTDLGFTNKRLIGKTGLLKTQSLDTPLNKINNVSVSSGLVGKLLGYGTINITSSSGAYSFVAVKDPEGFKNALLAQVDQFDEDRIKKQANEMAQAMKSV